MFIRRITVERIDAQGRSLPCPLRWIDSFAMRNFTNDAIFDDTLPAADGLLEAGLRVPLEQLQAAMEDWFRRKGYITAEERLEVKEQPREAQQLSEPGRLASALMRQRDRPRGATAAPPSRGGL
jgi:hypothetical protein